MAQPATKIVPEEFVVKPGAVRYWKFDAVAASTKVSGAFRVSGGARNDIRVVIADWGECINFLNGNGADSLYDSGKKTVSYFDLKLTRGTYCIAFDNRGSIVSAKEVAAKVFAARDE